MFIWLLSSKETRWLEREQTGKNVGGATTDGSTMNFRVIVGRTAP